MLPNSILLALVLVFLVHGLLYRLQVDDAFISYRYAWNFIHEQGLVFNPGEYVEGYSNFLWVILLGIFSLSGIEISICGVILSFLSTTWMIVEFRRLETRLMTDSPPPGWLRVWILGASGVVAAWMFAGMEGPLYMALQIRLLHCLISSRWIEGGLLAGLVGLVRLEGGGLMLPVALWILLRERSGGRMKRGLQFLGVAGLIWGAYTCWRWMYFCRWIPNVVTAKLGLDPWEAVHQGTWYLWIQGWPYLLIAAICVIWARLSGARVQSVVAGSSLKWLMVALTGCETVLILLSGGDWMAGGRYFLFLLPWIVFLLPLDVRTAGGGRRWPLALQAGFLIILLCHSLLTVTMLPLAQAMREQVAGLRVIGQWLEAHVPHDFRLAVRPCGALAYEASGHRCIDMFGLTDSRIAELGKKDPLATPGHVSTWDEDIARRQPEIIVPGGAGFFSLPLFNVEPVFQEKYQAVVIRFPEVQGRFGQYLTLLVLRGEVDNLDRHWSRHGEFQRVVQPGRTGAD